MTGLLVQETQHDLPFDTEIAMLVPDSLPDDQLGHRNRFDGGGNSQDIPHLRRPFVVAGNGDDRDRHTFFLAPFDRISAIGHHAVPGTFEVTDIIGVVYDSHLVRFVVTNRE